MSGRMLRIANGQGFWGDSPEAPVRLIEDGPLDYLTLDYLAEVTMSILQKQKRRDASLGYAADFVELIRRVLPGGARRGGAAGRRDGPAHRDGHGRRHPRPARRAARLRNPAGEHGRRATARGDPRSSALCQRLHRFLRRRRGAAGRGTDRRLGPDDGSRAGALAPDRRARLAAGRVGPARRGNRGRTHRGVRRAVHGR